MRAIEALGGEREAARLRGGQSRHAFTVAPSDDGAGAPSDDGAGAPTDSGRKASDS